MIHHHCHRRQLLLPGPRVSPRSLYTAPDAGNCFFSPSLLPPPSQQERDYHVSANSRWNTAAAGSRSSGVPSLSLVPPSVTATQDVSHLFRSRSLVLILDAFLPVWSATASLLRAFFTGFISDWRTQIFFKNTFALCFCFVENWDWYGFKSFIWNTKPAFNAHEGPPWGAYKGKILLNTTNNNNDIK